MNTLYRKSAISLAILSALSLSACNVDINANGQPVASLSTTKTGVIVDMSKGVTINGITYDTGEAIINNNGLDSDSSTLKNGMLVSVSGTVNADGTGKADTISYEDEVKGVVLTNNVTTDSTQISTGTLDVMGQTVRVDKDTVFESFDVTDLSISDIDASNVVEVSGYASGDGEIWATRIEVKDSQYNDGEVIELKGNISRLNGSSFNIGNQVINAENAAVDIDFMGTFKNGQYVEVKSSTGLNTDGVLLANEVDLKGNGIKEVSHSENDDQVEIKGIITSALNAGELEVNGSPITISPNTQVSASSFSQLDKGVIVEVSGNIDSNGDFIATKLQVEATDEESDNKSDDSNTNVNSGNNADDLPNSGSSESNSTDADSGVEVNEISDSDNDGN